MKVASERGGRGVLHAPLLHEAGITCSLSTYERNDEVITPTSEQIQDMRWWEWAIVEIQSCVSGYDGNSKIVPEPTLDSHHTRNGKFVFGDAGTEEVPSARHHQIRQSLHITSCFQNTVEVFI